ncbi:MAG: chemotaxis protein CheD [Acidobacteria bacterium]|nr:chemotaxis protein CheD [Acidobacteriota bacterium]MDW7983662.1 chemotaxis protein CheD [Acidobacteriota bacterium]
MATGHHVGIGQFAIAWAPDHLMALGLGSCIGLFVWSDRWQVGGLAHILLPAGPYGQDSMPCRYADRAVDVLLEALRQAVGSTPGVRWQAKLIGGAMMFHHITHPVLRSISQRTAEAVRMGLRRYHVRVVAEDLGGYHGRSVWAYPATGAVRVRNHRAEYWL